MTGDEFKDAVVLITGAAGAIGRTICSRFDTCGARVYRTDLVPIDSPRFIQGDLSDAAFPRQCLQRVIDDAGRIDILVNNAGICPRTAIPEITVEEWRHVMDVNLLSAFLLSQACIEVMVKQRAGVIINLASLAGKVGGIAVGAHYSASKAALVCLTKTLARHGAPCGVRVNAVAPGVIDTDITRAAMPEQRVEFLKTIPMGRIADPAEVAGPVLFLCSQDASYITGVTLDVNGGLLMD